MMSEIDVVLAEIIRNRLVAATEDMAQTLIRTAYNPLLYEVQDFSITIMSAEGDMWAETPGVIVFSQAFPHAVKAGIRHWNGNFSEGDVLIVNDPFETGTHISDTNLYMPAFYKGELVGFCGTAAHWADIGGKNPGGWCPDTTDMFQEGMCFRHQKIVEAGKKNDGLWDFISNNVRVPVIVKGDLEAQIAACRQGVARVQALCEKYGADMVKASMDYVVHETDKSMRAEITKMPDGEYGSSIRLDSDGVNPDGEFLVCLKVTVDGDSVHFSLNGSSPTAHGPINLPAPCTKGILASSIKGLLMPFDPCNAGHTMCLDYELPAKTLINPERPAPTDSYGYLVECLMELMFRCFANIIPERCPAGGYQLTGGFITRTQTEYGDPFVMTDPVHGGNGATFDGDGPTNQLTGNGDLPTNPIEVMETRHPVMVDQLTFSSAMAGAGKFRGGLGVIKDYRFLGDGCYVSLVTENTTDVTAKGVDGAENGKPGYFVINPGEPSEQRLTKRVSSIGPFHKGTVLRVVTGGGGGWGKATERDPELVLYDVRNGFITAETAQKVYGVAVTETDGQWVVDEKRTRELRAA
jgi:N-methylhydantoinase B